MSDWMLIIGGLALVLLAAYAATASLRRRQRVGDLEKESAAARRAIRLAETARDAGTIDVPDAERLYNRAQALMSGVPNAATARKAAGMAQRAERLWNRQNVAMRGRYGTDVSAAGDKAGRLSRPGKTGRSPADRYVAAIAARPKIDGTDVVRIASVVLLGLIGLIFISSQTQQPDVTFAGQIGKQISPTAIDTAPLPTYDQVVEQYSDAPIVRLPGATAVVDTALATEWLDKSDARQIVLAPPLSPDAEDTMTVPDDVVLVHGTYTSFGGFSTTSSDFSDMQQTFATSDVTTSVVALIAHSIDVEMPEDLVEVSWREPTPDELAPVLAALESDGIAFVGGAEPFEIPAQATEAYPEGVDPLIVVTPHAAPGQPAVRYADAVAAQFPNRPVVAMTGLWIDFAGSYAQDFEAPLTASFYGQFGERLEKHAYSQETVLRLALNRVQEFRHSGIFDQPLPYQAPDPLELTLPALPWICGALGLTAVAASIVQIRRQRLDTPTPADGATVHRLAGLSELAVEVSGLTEGRSKASLSRALRALAEAQEVIEGTSEGAEVVAGLLERAERELETVAERIGRPEYRPATFLEARWS